MVNIQPTKKLDKSNYCLFCGISILKHENNKYCCKEHHKAHIEISQSGSVSRSTYISVLNRIFNDLDIIKKAIVKVQLSAHGLSEISFYDCVNSIEFNNANDTIQTLKNLINYTKGISGSLELPEIKTNK